MSDELPVTFKSKDELNEYVSNIVKDALVHALHPELGSEWDAPDGVIYKAVESAKTELQDRIVRFWHNQHGWIPGAAWRAFADVLGVEPERMMTERRKTRQKVPVDTSVNE
jgi:hypothetical protein